MSGEPDNLILDYLRRIDGKVDRLTDSVADLVFRRVTSLEAKVALLHAEVGQLHGDFAAQSSRLDLV
jgi:hypothetical protein